MENTIIFLIIMTAVVTFATVVIFRARADVYWFNRFDGTHGTIKECLDLYYEYKDRAKSAAAVGGTCLVILAFILISILV